jgi:hypothetical protein
MFSIYNRFGHLFIRKNIEQVTGEYVFVCKGVIDNLCVRVCVCVQAGWLAGAYLNWRDTRVVLNWFIYVCLILASL